MKTKLHTMALGVALMLGIAAPAGAANFDVYLPTHLRYASGYVDSPGDPSGTWNKGINMGKFELYAKSLLNVAPTVANLKALTDAQAGLIYKKDDWTDVHGDEIELQELANVMFHFQVSTGQGVRQLQRTLNGMGASPPFQIDGKWTDATLAALKKVDQKVVYAKYKEGCRQFYKNEVAAKPELNKYLKGWLARIDVFPVL